MKTPLFSVVDFWEKEIYNLCNGFEFRDYFYKQHIILNHVF